jgi:hypothetical protein
MSYLFEYEGPSARPKWVRSITDSDGLEQKVVLNFNNEEERESLTVAEVYLHLDNLVQYMKDVSQTIAPVKLDETPSDGWHFKGMWGEVEWAKDEAFLWWRSVYYKNEPSEGAPEDV